MLTWSDNPIHESFSIKLFLDTNILVYLIDNTYQSLSDYLQIAKESPFCDLVSSRYALFEFVGVRKREQYIRKVADKVRVLGRGEVNYSSLTKPSNLDHFSAPEVAFEDIFEEIKVCVKNEIENIVRNFGINLDYGNIHEDQLSPAVELCLSSKINNQDSFILISSVMPSPRQNEDIRFFLTNDSQFENALNFPGVDPVFKQFSLNKPQFNILGKIIWGNGTNINLKKNYRIEKLKEYFVKKFLQLIKEKNNSLYLGNTFSPKSSRIPPDIVCFKLRANCKLPNNVFVTVLDKNLEFIYTTKNKVEYFHNNNNPVTKDYVVPPDHNNISFKVSDKDDSGNVIPVSNEIINALRCPGNLVFIHPDSEIDLE